eukprot:10216566-Alexandrium_andersonii.AAC.1
MTDAGGAEPQQEEQGQPKATRNDMSMEGIPDEQISQMLDAMSMSEKAVVMKKEPGKTDQEPPRGGVQDA